MVRVSSGKSNEGHNAPNTWLVMTHDRPRTGDAQCRDISKLAYVLVTHPNRGLHPD